MLTDEQLLVFADLWLNHTPGLKKPIDWGEPMDRVAAALRQASRMRRATSPMIRMLDAKEWRESVDAQYHHVTIGYNITTEAGEIVEIAPFNSKHYGLGGYGSAG
jgi:hypothetical protein